MSELYVFTCFHLIKIPNVENFCLFALKTLRGSSAQGNLESRFGLDLIKSCLHSETSQISFQIAFYIIKKKSYVK